MSRALKLCLAMLFASLTIPQFVVAQTRPASNLRPPEQQKVEVAQAAPVLEAHNPPQELKVTAYTLPPYKLAQAEALYRIRTALYLGGTFLEIAALLLLVKLRVGPTLRNVAERACRNLFFQVMIVVAGVMLLVSGAVLPVRIYGHHVSLSYGLSVQRWGSWIRDWAKGEALAIGVSILAAYALFKIIRWSPQRWWFYFWLLTLPFMLLLVFVAPVVLGPLFNKFEPLERTQPQLVNAIEQVTHRGGLDIPADRMFEMKASEKVTTYNAYVTGVGATKRVVVWDNTVRDMTIPETLFIFGHEMGHYVLDHIYKGLAFGAALGLIGIWLGRKIVLRMLARWGSGWRVRGIDDVAVVPVLMLTLAMLTFVGEPIGNAFSRHIEHEADRYGLEVTHALFPGTSEVAAASFQKLGEKSLDYPDPNRLLVFWSYSHPPLSDRVRFALKYDPWHTPEGPRYVK